MYHLLPSSDGYLTEEGNIKFRNLDVLFKDISKLEQELFKINLRATFFATSL
jgi:5'-3' exonuclease